MDPSDELARDATYKLGMMLSAVGRAEEGLGYLEKLRPVLVAEYGAACGPGDRHDPDQVRGDQDLQPEQRYAAEAARYGARNSTS